MDDPGWHARRRAAEQAQGRYPVRGPDGRYQPTEQVQPMNESFIGGFAPQPSPIPTGHHPHHHGFHFPQPDPNGNGPPPPVPPKQSRTSLQSDLTQMTAAERSQHFKVAKMHPNLQFMCGPLLRYDTVDERGVWHGAAMIVTVDAGSTYEPNPMLTYEWDPTGPNFTPVHRVKQSLSGQGKSTYDLGPHPADPMAPSFSQSPTDDGHMYQSPQARKETVPGQELWAYVGNAGSFTFWRFLIEIPLGDKEMKIRYSINHGIELNFFVPGRQQTMRLAAYSCNGFSAGVNPDDFRGPGFQTGYDPVWVDLLAKHDERPFHALVGGGDQLYCDGLTREPEMQDWVTQAKPEDKMNYTLTEEMALAIDRFYFNHYCQVFRSGAFARANSSIPMMNMCDDHDLIDGFGSYPDALQQAQVFKTIGARGYWFFLIFQCFINPNLDGLNDAPGSHVNKSLIIGQRGPFIPFPSHSFLSYIGPTSYCLMLDCRAERKLSQVCSEMEYRKVFDRLQALPRHVEHLIVQLGIPIAYPRMVFLETMLSSKLNPLVSLGRSGSLGLKGFVNKFNADAELLDDLNDHWTSKHHKTERNWFLEQLQQLAIRRRIRITFVSGDVHCAAVGVLKTLTKKKAVDVPPEQDYRYMLNIVSSAIVNTPPPAGVLALVGQLSTKTHRTMHYCETDETMMPIFDKDTNGTNNKNKFIMGRRNWCSIVYDEHTGDFIFDIRVEKEKGNGETVGYVTRAPAPKWQPIA